MRSAGLASRRRASWNAPFTATRAAPSHHSVVVALASVAWRTAQRLGLTSSVERSSELAWRAETLRVVRSTVNPPLRVASVGRR